MRELRERAESIVRILCLILAALLVYELAGVGIRWNPFHGVTVPELPALMVATNGPSGATHPANLTAMPVSQGTNNATQRPTTNAPQLMAMPGTNSVLVPATKNKQTNLLARTDLTHAGTNSLINASNHIVVELETKSSATNPGSAMISTNSGTNLVSSPSATETNPAAAKSKKKNANPMAMAGMDSNPFQPPGKRGTDLPPAMQSRISRITDSEILGPVMRPLPMALLGIAGEFAFLRSDSGQTGLVKAGDSLDDIKLLRIGINRVLIEQSGQKKELMIFSGYGGDSLMPKDSSNENNHP